MKNNFLLISALLVGLSGCADETLNDILPESGMHVSTNAIIASLPGESGFSRVTITVNGKRGELTWTKGDQLAVFNKSGKRINFELEQGENTKNGIFTPLKPSEVPDGFVGSYAVFPFAIHPKSVEDGITVTLPDEYTGKELASQNAPMLGKIDEAHKVTFKHLGGMLRVNVKGIPAGYNTIRVVADRPIAGSFKVSDVNAAAPYLEVNTEDQKGKNSISVTKSQNTEAFYFPIPVGHYGKICVYADHSTSSSEQSQLLFEATNKDIQCGKMYAIDKTSVDVLKRMQLNIRETSYKSVNVNNVTTWMSQLNSTSGKFSDLQSAYTKPHTSAGQEWAALEHLRRLETLSLAYSDSKMIDYYHNSELLKKIKAGLNFWITPNSHQESKGWWDQRVAQNKSLGLIVIRLMENPSADLNDIIPGVSDFMCDKIGNNDKEGANKLDIALCWLYRGCIIADESILKTAVKDASDVIVYTTKEGFQCDGTFFQHGQQLYIGGYGEEALKSVLGFALAVKGTSYALSDSQVQIIRDFLLKAYYPSIRGKYMSFSVLGRSVSRPKTLDKTNAVMHAERMKEIDPSHAQDYQQVIDCMNAKDASTYPVPTSHTHFFRGDYTLHTSPNFTFDVRMSSKYTCRSEYGNGENLKGYFIADGSTNIRVKGDEYFDIFPVWDWAKVPGVTAPSTLTNDNIPTNGSQWGVLGNSTFAGGVSDGKLGATAYAYSDYKVNIDAKKSWFFFENEVVETGYVHSSSSAITSINQCRGMNSGLSVNGDPKGKSAFGKNYLAKNDRVSHGRIGYIYLDGDRGFVARKNQSGTWASINQNKKSDIVSQDVVTVGIETTSQHPTYACILVPGVSSFQLEEYYKEYYKRNSVQIVENSDKVQSVYHQRLDNWQTVFFAANQKVTLSSMLMNLTLQADKPCIVMIQRHGMNYTCSVADPSRQQSEIKLIIGGNGAGARTLTHTVTFDTSAQHAGETVGFSFTSEEIDN